MPRTLVALATYNEIENLPGLSTKFFACCRTPMCSSSTTIRPTARAAGATNRPHNEPRLHCLHRPGKQGLGSATLAAARYAIEHDYDVFVTLDADWSHDPRHLPELVRATEKADVAIGSRYCAGGGIEGWPLHRRLAEPLRQSAEPHIAAIAGSRHERRVPRLSCQPSCAKSISTHSSERLRVPGRNSLALHRAGATFVEVPITFHERRAGRSKISVGRSVHQNCSLSRGWQ